MLSLIVWWYGKGKQEWYWTGQIIFVSNLGNDDLTRTYTAQGKWVDKNTDPLAAESLFSYAITTQKKPGISNAASCVKTKNKKKKKNQRGQASLAARLDH